MVKNRIHAILAKNNKSHEFSDLFGKQGIAFLKTVSLPGVHRLAIDGYLSILEIVGRGIKVATKKIHALAKRMRELNFLPWSGLLQHSLDPEQDWRHKPLPLG